MRAVALALRTLLREWRSGELAVLLLARWADITDKRSGECPLDVAPMLESIGSLETAGELLRALHREPAYRKHLEARADRQRVVIGYSDTNKQGGIAASRWALQVAQTQMLEAAHDTGFVVSVIHGRGGTPARGGGRAYLPAFEHRSAARHRESDSGPRN